MLRVLMLIVACTPASCFAQELVSYAGLDRADLVVVGTLHHDFKFPWIDGWNERGHIDIDRILKGSFEQTKVPFAWERDFRAGWCLTRPDWRGAVGTRCIWVLTRNGNHYRAPSLFGGFLDLKYLQEVNKALH